MRVSNCSRNSYSYLFVFTDASMQLRYTVVLLTLIVSVAASRTTIAADRYAAAAADSSEGRDLAELSAYIEQARVDWDVPGLAVAVIKDGEVVLQRGFGTRAVGDDTPVDEHTLFAIASNTKAFVTTALGMMVEQEMLDWDDPVRQHLPYFELYDPYVSNEMRVRDLLCHRSGLGVYSGDLIWYGTGYSAEETVRRARHLRPAGSFRAHYGYNNIMFIAAGELFPALTGETWDRVLRSRILDPLGMDETVTSVHQLDEGDNVATPHKYESGTWMPLEWYPWETMGAAGGIISSASDMSRWLRLQLGRGMFDGRRYFGENTQRELWTPHTTISISEFERDLFPSTHFKTYGLGWRVFDYLGEQVVAHSGGYDGMNSRVALVPDRQLGIVILTNAMTSIQTALTYRILDHFLADEAETDWSAIYKQRWLDAKDRDAQRLRQMIGQRIPDAAASVPAAAYAGRYGGPVYGDATVSVEDSSLVLRLLPNPDMVADLVHLHYDTFAVYWRYRFAWFGSGTAQFVVEDDGSVSELKMDIPNHDLWFTELEFLRKE
jgi:CubicO group peptidase (beta-lactamase class C family)